MPAPGYLEAVRELTRREGALLVFDEVITGFRFALGGGQELFGVTPDLACVGKAMANGYPLSAVVGRRDVMEIFDEIFFSFTFGGEAVSLAASLATIGELERLGLSQLWERGAVLQDGLNALAAEHGLADRVQCIGPSVRTIVAFRGEDGGEDLHAKSVFQQECVKRGVLFPGYHNMTFSHTDADLTHTLAVYRAALEALAAGAPLEGAPLEPVFRRP
jgi:glutamate-1-semialdehyde 2,1-aminomutase/spore coat polysaccharide biosynthesis protein SpsF